MVQVSEFAELPSLAPTPTAAERAADVIQQHIFEGKLRPGTALPETMVAQALQVSRNTVREAFRRLINDHLLVYETHKGVSVRRLGADDVRDIYRLRRMLELSAVDLIEAGAATADQAALRQAVDGGERAALAGRWLDVGTENLMFHKAIVAAHGSVRIDDFFRRLMTEMRLGFLAVPGLEAFHGRFLDRNREILGQFAAGRMAEVRAALASYLEDAERPVLAAVESA